jgi:hypothetical protein
MIIDNCPNFRNYLYFECTLYFMRSDQQQLYFLREGPSPRAVHPRLRCFGSVFPKERLKLKSLLQGHTKAEELGGLVAELLRRRLPLKAL